jgi:hypothetical protein
VKGNKIALAGSFSGDTGKLFRSLPLDDIFHLSLVGRELSLQVRGEKLEEVMKALRKLGVSNLNVQEWKRYGVTVAGSGSAADDDKLLSVSVMPATLGTGMRPLSVPQSVQIDRKLYVELIVNLEVALGDAQVTDAIYILKVEKQASREKYVDAVKAAALAALFDAGGIKGID